MSETKTALVTGASSGIGFAVAKELASRGYKVYACARRLEQMEPLKTFGVIPFVCDVANIESIANAKKFIQEETGGTLNILFNNAGQSCTFPALDVTDENFQQCFEVNVYGPIRMTREFGPMIINAKGCIAFTGSLAGITPFPFASIYAATKAAIHQYAAILRVEMKPFGVKVLNIITGGVKTNIADSRPLPESSLYNIPEMQVGLQTRREMALRSNPISAEAYAIQVVNDMTSSRNILNVYRGKLAISLGIFATFIPRFILEYFILRKFQILPAFDRLKKIYAKKHID